MHTELHLTDVWFFFVSVQEPGQAEHPAAWSSGELRPAGQMFGRLCDGVQ